MRAQVADVFNIQNKEKSKKDENSMVEERINDIDDSLNIDLQNHSRIDRSMKKHKLEILTLDE